MSRLVTVVNIESLSYSGTTWINLLLGCHPRAMALGPPNRVVDLFYEGSSDGHDACRVHAEQCTFWPRFFAQADRSRNFFVQVAELCERDIIVINNAFGGGRAAAELRHPDIMVKRVGVVRDGRAILASYGKYHPESDFLDTITQWFCPFAASVPYERANPDVLSVRYEDVVCDQRGFIDKAGRFIGIEYPQDFVRFWAFPHHLIGCNPGPLALIQRHLGVAFRGVNREEQEQRYQRLLRDPHDVRVDERWKEELGIRDRLVFDFFAGGYNEAWGYERDRFTLSEIRRFQADFTAAASARTRDGAPGTPDARELASFAASLAPFNARTPTGIRGSVHLSRRTVLILVFAFVLLYLASIGVTILLAAP